MNPLDDRVSLFEYKTLASLKVSEEARANLVRSDLKKRAEDLDARLPYDLAGMMPRAIQRINPIWILGASRLHWFGKLSLAARVNALEWWANIYEVHHCGRLCWNVVDNFVGSENFQSKRKGHMHKQIGSHFRCCNVEMENVV
jgi:hypothetical protein